MPYALFVSNRVKEMKGVTKADIKNTNKHKLINIRTFALSNYYE